MVEMTKKNKSRGNLQQLVLCIPGIRPRAMKRNVLVVLFYLLLIGLLISLYLSL